MTERLFHAGPPTPTERAGRRRAHQLAQLSLLLEDHPRARPVVDVTCPACAGSPLDCTCDRTGAQAIELL